MFATFELTDGIVGFGQGMRRCGEYKMPDGGALLYAELIDTTVFVVRALPTVRMRGYRSQVVKLFDHELKLEDYGAGPFKLVVSGRDGRFSVYFDVPGKRRGLGTLERMNGKWYLDDTLVETVESEKLLTKAMVLWSLKT